MINKNDKHNEILDVYVAAVHKHAEGAMSDEQFIKIRNHVANMFVPCVPIADKMLVEA